MEHRFSVGADVDRQQRCRQCCPAAEQHRAAAELSGAPQTRLNRYFDTSQFTVPAPFTFGNVARTLPDARGPSRVNYDLAVQKSFPIAEPLALVFRSEAFNLTNTPYFFAPGEGLGSNTFGVINSATGERTVQFSLKLIF